MELCQEAIRMMILILEMILSYVKIFIGISNKVLNDIEIEDNETEDLIEEIVASEVDDTRMRWRNQKPYMQVRGRG